MVSATARDAQRTATALAARVWFLLEKWNRTREEDHEMLHAAHASRCHWGEVDSRIDHIRGEWLCSRVYAVLERAEPALFHARRCRELCEGVELEEVELGYSYEALARAQMLASKRVESRKSEHLGRAHCRLVEDADERDMLLADLSEIARKRAQRKRASEVRQALVAASAEGADER